MVKCPYCKTEINVIEMELKVDSFSFNENNYLLFSCPNCEELLNITKE